MLQLNIEAMLGDHPQTLTTALRVSGIEVPFTPIMHPDKDVWTVNLPSTTPHEALVKVSKHSSWRTRAIAYRRSASDKFHVLSNGVEVALLPENEAILAQEFVTPRHCERCVCQSVVFSCRGCRGPYSDNSNYQLAPSA